MAVFKWPTALQELLATLIKPEPLQPNTVALPPTLPRVSRDTIVFNSLAAATHVPGAACRTAVPPVTSSLHPKVMVAPVHVRASSWSRGTTVSHRTLAGCATYFSPNISTHSRLPAVGVVVVAESVVVVVVADVVVDEAVVVVALIVVVVNDTVEVVAVVVVDLDVVVPVVVVAVEVVTDVVVDVSVVVVGVGVAVVVVDVAEVVVDDADVVVDVPVADVVVSVVSVLLVVVTGVLVPVAVVVVVTVVPVVVDVVVVVDVAELTEHSSKSPNKKS